MSVPIFMILKGMKKLDDEMDQKAKQVRHLGSPLLRRIVERPDKDHP